MLDGQALSLMCGGFRTWALSREVLGLGCCGNWYGMIHFLVDWAWPKSSKRSLESYF